MSRFKIINLIDKLFVTCAVFLIVFAWINFYLRDLWITFVLSLIFSFAIMFVFYYFCNKKQTKKILNKQQIENINTQFYIFKLNSITQKLKLIQQILSKNFKPEIKDNSIFYVDNTKKIMVIIKTKHPVIDHNILLNIIEELNTENFDELHIICDDIDLNIDSKLFNNKEIKFITKKTLYLDYFLKYNIFPDNSNINLKNNTFNISSVLKNMFTPQKARGYFFCGLVLIFSSIILPYHFYYIIVGSTLLMFSIICKLLPNFKD